MEKNCVQHFLIPGGMRTCVEEYQLEKISIKPLTHNIINNIIAIVGRRGMGKTDVVNGLINDILVKNFDIEFEILIVSSSNYNMELYKDAIHTPRYLNHIIKYCQDNPLVQKILIIDDYVKSYGSNLCDFFMNRKLLPNTTLIITTQILKNFIQNMRSNTDYFLFAKTDSKSDIKSVYDSFMSLSIDYHNFENIYNITTNNFNFFGINTLSKYPNNLISYKSNLDNNNNKNYKCIDVSKLSPIDNIKEKKRIIREINHIKSTLSDLMIKLDDLVIDLDQICGD
ncbi:hypothetical protein CE11_00853 [Megavirus courdo11]|uniref:Uncharacterized protein n=3 Tax=Megamimivirinae TaxID=3044648 RepID=A0A2L2DN66_MIMIV|nr:hypothetical protein MegaChil _gp0780 [Megavirus chiliensis]AEQ33091.1 P-loop containing nucleoside triphosphate hydrolase domain-containing protein [Megavirus chiliensis]AFX92879.1 hypothetical protein CE11_00853 [Megavirus courdo11]AVG47615.1 hypothetical protein [Acanthamoeba polyphaga mimivirus]